MLRAQNLKIENVMTVMINKQKQTKCHISAMEPNPWKDRAMHKGGNPSF
jgi:hypothetical protein